jgi:lipid-binding SYLF domain-containing protein
MDELALLGQCKIFRVRRLSSAASCDCTVLRCAATSHASDFNSASSLKGAVLRRDADANKALYGKNVSPNDLLVEGNIGIPEAGQKFVDMLKRGSGAGN